MTSQLRLNLADGQFPECEAYEVGDSVSVMVTGKVNRSTPGILVLDVEECEPSYEEEEEMESEDSEEVESDGEEEVAAPKKPIAAIVISEK